MTLLAAWALWFIAVAGGVVALYLLKIKRRTATVPVLDFWLALAGQTKVHSLFNRLKRLLSMLLWLVIVACLILALGNPILSLGRIKPRAIAVVIDNSASMQAAEGDEKAKETRLALAKRALEEISSSRPVTDEWLVIEAGSEPRVVQAWTFDTKLVRKAGEAIKPFNGAGKLSASVELAGQLVAGKPDPCILVISDGAAGEVERLAGKDARVLQWPVGMTSDNVGIGHLAVRAHRQNGNYLALVSVVNATDEKVEIPVALEVDGKSQSVEMVSVGARSTAEKTVVIDAPNGGVLRASIDRKDALALDNEAFAVLEPITPAVVWLVTDKESAFFFEQALGSMDPLVWAEESLTLTPGQYGTAVAALAKQGVGASGTATSAGAAESHVIKKPDLVIFNGWVPAELPKAGRFVFVNACPAEFGTTVAGGLVMPQMHMAPKAHALMQHITLQGAGLSKAQKVTLKTQARVLVQSGEGSPLIFLVEQPERQSLCLVFDVLESELPFRNAFPLLLRNAVSYMHEEAPSWVRGSYALGDTVRPVRAVPAEIKEVGLTVQRDGKKEDVKAPVVTGSFAFADTGRAGVLRLMVGDEASFAAMNIGNAEESRIGPVASGVEAHEKLGLSKRWLGGMPWTLLACLAAIGVAFEWLTYHLRWTE